MQMGVNGCIIGLCFEQTHMHITPEILNLIAQIDEFKGSFKYRNTRVLGEKYYSNSRFFT